MTERDPEILSEEEAARFWGRAAQLQAEAGARIEGPEVDDAPVPTPGYALTNVRSAALEAGIAPEFVEAALADFRAGRALSKVEKSHALARRFLNHPPNTITVRRIIEASSEKVLSAMEATFPATPFRLVLTDQQGDPLDRGVLVFDIPERSNPFQRGFGFVTAEAGLRQVFVSLRPIEGPTPSCEMTVHSPVTSHNIGFGIGTVAATLTGGVGFKVLGGLGVATGIGPIAAVGGVLLGVGLGVKGFRALYSYAMRKALRALEGLVGAVAVRAKGVWRGQVGG